MPNVYWLISAQRALLRALSPCVPAARRGDVYRRICRILARTFPKAAVVLVRERLQGYRTHYDRHVLLVEVVNQIEGLDLFQEGRPRRKPAESVPALVPTI